MPALVIAVMVWLKWISDYEVDKKEQFGATVQAEEIKPPAQEINFTNSKILNKMIKG